MLKHDALPILCFNIRSSVLLIRSSLPFSRVDAVAMYDLMESVNQGIWFNSSVSMDLVSFAEISIAAPRQFFDFFIMDWRVTFAWAIVAAEGFNEGSTIVDLIWAVGVVGAGSVPIKDMI